MRRAERAFLAALALMWAAAATAGPPPDPGTGLPPERGGLCLVPSSLSGKNVLVDCRFFIEWPSYYIGFGTTEAERCAHVGPDQEFPLDPFGITISRSSTDPFDTLGPLTSNRLYLWISPIEGWAAGEFGLGGTLAVTEFRPSPGVRNIGTHTDLKIAAPCQTRYAVLGEIILASPVPVTPDTWGRIKARYR